MTCFVFYYFTSHRCKDSQKLVPPSECICNILRADRPEPPIDVRVADCSAESAEVRFRPDSDNNSPITSFTVYYSLGNTAEFVEGATVRPTSNGQDLVATIPVRPWRTYSFRVTATNVHGVSDPSVRSQNLCDSPQTAPQRNPLNVCTKNKASTQLNIIWDVSMPTSF